MRIETVVVPRTAVKVNMGASNKLAFVKESVTLRESVVQLNALGVGARNLI